MSVSIRRMTLEDVGMVFDIEKSAHITPWSKKIISDCISVGYGCFVITKDNVIKGFMIVRGLKQHSHLLNLCITPASQGQHFGEALLLFLIDLLKNRCRKLVLEVRESNLPAIALYHKHGFIKAQIKKKYYADKGDIFEDAIVLERLF